MHSCHVIPTVAPSLGQRLAEALSRWFSHSLASREAIDQAWVDTGLGRLSRATLVDIGAPTDTLDAAERREAWSLLSALDANRHL